MFAHTLDGEAKDGGAIIPGVSVKNLLFSFTSKILPSWIIKNIYIIYTSKNISKNFEHLTSSVQSITVFEKLSTILAPLQLHNTVIL